MKKYLEIYLKNLENHWNIMEFCQSGKVGTLTPWKPGISLQIMVLSYHLGEVGTLILQNKLFTDSKACV